MSTPTSPTTTESTSSSTSWTSPRQRTGTAPAAAPGVASGAAHAPGGSADGSKLGPPVALLTGSTRGIGLACARALCEAGFHCVLSARSAGGVAAAVGALRGAGYSASGLSCHAEDSAARRDLVRHAVSASGKRRALSVVVICAAASPARGPALAGVGAPFAKMLALNVRAAAETVRDARPYLERGSVVVIVGSIAGYTPLPNIGLYSVTKAAAHALVRVLANELAPDIRVVGVAPGLIRTKFSQSLWEGQRAKRVVRFIPLQRLGEPDDVGRVVRFLCSKDAAYITGETIVVAGGMHSRL